MRAREPDREGDRNRDGVRLHDGVFGSGEPTLVLVPSNPDRAFPADDDRCQLHAGAERLAELTGAPLITMEGTGHMLPARHPVKINLLIKDFVDHPVKPEERHRSA